MKKTFVIALLFTSLFSIQDAYAQLKIGYSNPAKILNQIPAVEEVNKQVEELIGEKDQELAEKATSLQQTFSAFEQNAQGLTDQERIVQEQELLELNEQFETERNKMLEEVQQKRAEWMQPIIQQMNAAISEVATEMELDLILNEGTSSGDMIIFFANSERLDVTDKVVEKIKQS